MIQLTPAQYAAQYAEDFGAHFWARVDRREDPDACWPWTGPRDARGYGRLYIPRSVCETLNVGRTSRAGVVACGLAHGPKPEGPNGPVRSGAFMALHSCDNPPCCNPGHLRWGTAADNHADAVKNGRLMGGAATFSRRRAG